MRTSSGDAYNYEMNDVDHEELLRALLEHKGMALISRYDHEMYNDMLRGWRKETMRTIAECAVQQVECLWVNPAAEELGQMKMKME